MGDENREQSDLRPLADPIPPNVCFCATHVPAKLLIYLGGGLLSGRRNLVRQGGGASESQFYAC